MGSTVVLTGSVDLDAVIDVYRKVHAADLHLVDHSDPMFDDRLRWTVEAPGFAAAVAYVDGELAGALMGCPLPPETLWWRGLTSADDPDVTTEWEGRTFGLCEAFVLPEYQRHRLGIRMITELLLSRPEHRVSMAVAETNTRVWGALQAMRFRHVGDLEPFPGWRSHRMLVRELR